MIEQIAWDWRRLGEVLHALAVRGEVATTRRIGLPQPPASAEAADAWIDAAAAELGCEAHPAVIRYGEVAARLTSGWPALVRVPHSGGQRFVAVVDAAPGGASLVAPDLSVRRVSWPQLRQVLCRQLEASVEEQLARSVGRLSLDSAARDRALGAMRHASLGQQPAFDCWHIMPSPGSSFLRQVHRAGALRSLAVMLAAHATQYALFLLSWWMVGRAALNGRFDPDWLLGWALVLLTRIPFVLLGEWALGMASVRAGAVLKRRLLLGALSFDPDELRAQGSGQLLGRVIESSAVESLGITGGFVGLLALIELAMAAVVLALGAGGWVHLLVLAGWVAVAAFLAVRFHRASRRWTAHRMEMTRQLVERMMGHRTRLAQEARERWHEEEDVALESYVRVSADRDRRAVRLRVTLHLGWVAIGIAGMAWPFVHGAADAAGLAVALGGVIVAARAFGKMGQSLAHLSSALLAWDEIADIFAAAARRPDGGSPAFASPTEDAAGSAPSDPHSPVLQALGLSYRYGPGRSAVVRDCTVALERGERVLLEGRSGSGKSTLVALLSGLRVPESGLMLLDGLDRATLGLTGWRRRVAMVPQFHQNHVLTESFAFNLLMGRRWPPTRADLEEAEAVCAELGLDEVLGKMPGGMFQMVGETGWQLSHGERSRLYLARALLQKPRLLVLDESFGALDPENLERALRCVLERTATLLVVAHP